MQVCSPSSLQRRKMRVDERPLHHRLAAGERDAALADLEHLRVLADLPHRARRRVTGWPLCLCQVSGLWQYWQRSRQPVRKSDEADAGPVHRAADLVRVHVADERRLPPRPPRCRPDARRNSRARPWSRRRPCARRGARSGCRSRVGSWPRRLHRAVEGAVDDVELLLARQLDEVHRVARHPDRELRILLRMLHRVLQRLAVEHVDVDVEAAAREVRVERVDAARDRARCLAAERRRARPRA